MLHINNSTLFHQLWEFQNASSWLLRELRPKILLFYRMWCNVYNFFSIRHFSYLAQSYKVLKYTFRYYWFLWILFLGWKLLSMCVSLSITCDEKLYHKFTIIYFLCLRCWDPIKFFLGNLFFLFPFTWSNINLILIKKTFFINFIVYIFN